MSIRNASQPHVSVVFRKIAEREAASDGEDYYQSKADCRPKKYAQLADDGKRDADAGGEADGFADELSACLVNTDHEGYQLKTHGNKSADGFEHESTEQAWNCIAQTAQDVPTFAHAQNNIPGFEKADGQKTVWIAAVEAVDEVFEPADVLAAFFENAAEETFVINPTTNEARKMPLADHHQKT